MQKRDQDKFSISSGSAEASLYPSNFAQLLAHVNTDTRAAG